MSWSSGGGKSSPASGSGRSPHHSRPSSSNHQQRQTGDLIEVKSKFDAEFRRFSIPKKPLPTMEEFEKTVSDLHGLKEVPFTLCYTDLQDELLPITNNNNFWKALESARPVLRLLIQRKGESWEEKYGYGTQKPAPGGVLGLVQQLRKPGLGAQQRNYHISMPEEFRVVSAIIDVDVVPETHRRVKLCKHGSDKPLGFYIRDGTSVRVTPAGVVKVPGIFISRLVPGGLAESTGLLAVNDEVLEVNGIEVQGKTLDQVTDMMVANASNLIVTVKPANLANTLSRGSTGRVSQISQGSEGARSSSLYASNSEDETDEVKDLLHASTMTN